MSASFLPISLRSTRPAARCFIVTVVGVDFAGAAEAFAPAFTGAALAGAALLLAAGFVSVTFLAIRLASVRKHGPRNHARVGQTSLKRSVNRAFRHSASIVGRKERLWERF